MLVQRKRKTRRGPARRPTLFAPRMKRNSVLKHYPFRSRQKREEDTYEKQTTLTITEGSHMVRCCSSSLPGCMYCHSGMRNLGL